MSVSLEKLLSRRYGLESDLWALRHELERLESDAQPLHAQLQAIATHSGVVKAQRRADLSRTLGPLQERMTQLRRQLQSRRRELFSVEGLLRAMFRSEGAALETPRTRQALRELGENPPVVTIQRSRDSTPSFPFDLFISHASEDHNIAHPLADGLRALACKVWYDRDLLAVGDSLRRSIDEGLRSSRYAVVLLSPSFLGKGWTTYELDSLVAREVEGHKVILPVWHKLTKDEVLRFSPNLADKVALNTATKTIDDIALDIAISVRRPTDV